MMTSSSMAFQTATELSQLIRDKEISCRELLEFYVSRVDAYNPQINAVVCMDLDRAYETAATADERLSSGEAIGPLHGIPMTVKEAFDVVGLPSTWGVSEFETNIAATNAHVVDALTSSGAIVFGKTNVPAWLADWQTFNPVYGTTNNPWDLTRVPGGSSGGSAAAVAAGLTVCEYGSDIAGSIRGPAHFCGVYGHKPTCDVVSQRGHAPPGVTFAPDIAAVGPVARSAADLELLLRVTAGPEKHMRRAWQLNLPESAMTTLAGFRIAIVEDDPNFAVDGEVREVLDDLYTEIEKAGAQLRRDIRPNFDSRELYELFVEMRYAATSGGQSDDDFRNNRNRLEGLSHNDSAFLFLSLRGSTLSHRKWLRINERREELRREWDRIFREVNLVLSPAAMTTAFHHDQAGERHERMVTVNGDTVPGTDQTFWAGLSGFFHLPSTVAPAGVGSSGMPVGVQIIGQRYTDMQCIQFAKILEQQINGFVAPSGYD